MKCHDIIDCLVAALEARDPYTEGHSMRVADMALELARRIGLKGADLEETHIAAHLHDIGKIGVRRTAFYRSRAVFCPTSGRQSSCTRLSGTIF